MHLADERVDVDVGTIEVRATWDDDPAVGEIEPKTRNARRRVPVVALLRPLLAEHRARIGRSGAALVFGATETRPFDPSTVRRRALKAWADAGLEPIGLHECRHSFASLMIAAGCNAKALSMMVGHASIQITFDRYGKLMPGSEAEVGALLDAYLDADA